MSDYAYWHRHVCTYELRRILSCTYVDPVKFSALVLVEPMLLPPPEIAPESDILTTGAVKRRDIWDSKAEALQLLQPRPAWRVWDPRVLKLYVVSVSAGESAF